MSIENELKIVEHKLKHNRNALINKLECIQRVADRLIAEVKHEKPMYVGQSLVKDLTDGLEPIVIEYSVLMGKRAILKGLLI